MARSQRYSMVSEDTLRMIHLILGPDPRTPDASVMENAINEVRGLVDGLDEQTPEQRHWLDRGNDVSARWNVAVRALGATEYRELKKGMITLVLALGDAEKILDVIEVTTKERTVGDTTYKLGIRKDGSVTLAVEFDPCANPDDANQVIEVIRAEVENMLASIAMTKEKLMGTLNEPGDYDCMAKVKPNEPYFAVLARDPDAPEMVRAWIEAQIAKGVPAYNDKLNEARQCAASMEAWRKEQLILAAASRCPSCFSGDPRHRPQVEFSCEHGTCHKECDDLWHKFRKEVLDR